MEVSKINIFNNLPNKTPYCKKATGYKLPYSLDFDTITFKSRNYSDTQLYRCAGVTEVENSCKGKKISGPFYATSDRRGWQSKDWNSGYNANGDNFYFIKFKRGSIDYEDARRFTYDTRYKIYEYTIDNIEEIRKGHSIHGELVYSDNFELEKAKDISNKKQEIESTINELRNAQKTDNIYTKAIDILKSYSEEFPKLKEIIALVESHQKIPEIPEKELFVTQSNIHKNVLNAAKKYIQKMQFVKI